MIYAFLVRGLMRQISIIEKSWTGKYLEKTKKVNKKILTMKDGVDEKGLVLRKRKHEEMLEKEKKTKE